MIIFIHYILGSLLRCVKPIHIANDENTISALHIACADDSKEDCLHCGVKGRGPNPKFLYKIHFAKINYSFINSLLLRLFVSLRPGPVSFQTGLTVDNSSSCDDSDLSKQFFFSQQCLPVIMDSMNLSTLLHKWWINGNNMPTMF